MKDMPRFLRGKSIDIHTYIIYIYIYIADNENIFTSLPYKTTIIIITDYIRHADD